MIDVAEALVDVASTGSAVRARPVTDAASEVDSTASGTRTARPVADIAPAVDQARTGFRQTYVDGAYAVDTVSRTVRLNRPTPDSAPSGDIVAWSKTKIRLVSDTAGALDNSAQYALVRAPILYGRLDIGWTAHTVSVRCSARLLDEWSVYFGSSSRYSATLVDTYWAHYASTEWSASLLDTESEWTVWPV
jgi:hypothetical protein